VLWEHLLHFAELDGEQLEEANFSQEGVEADFLHQARGEECEFQARGIDEDVEENPAHESALEGNVGAGI